MLTPPPTKNVLSNLPVLQKAADAYKFWHACHTQFPRLDKFSLGGKIDGLFTDLIELLLLAGYAGVDQKFSLVARAAAKLDLLKFFLLIAWEIKCMDHKKYAAITMPLHEVGKMIGGWQKQLKIKQSPLV